jgi:beta-glucosidase
VQSRTTASLVNHLAARLGAVRRTARCRPPKRPGLGRLVDRFQAAALQTPLAIPILYASTRCTATGTCSGQTVFPHNIGLGSTWTPNWSSGSNTSCRGDPGHRTAVGVRARACASAGRHPVGPHVREFLGEPGSGEPLCWRDRRIHRAGTSRHGSGARSAKHFAGDGDTEFGSSPPVDYTIDQGITVTNRPDFARLRPRAVPSRRRHHTTSAR